MPRRRTRRRATTSRPVALKRSAKSYASLNTYISAYYKKNKVFIDNNIADKWLETKSANGDPYKAFKNLIYERMTYTNPKTGKKYTVEQAINREKNSLDLRRNWDTVDIYANNFLNKIKSTTDLKKDIIELSKAEKITYKRKNKNGTYSTITRLKEGFKKENIIFEGYFNVLGTNTLVYRYDDVYIIEYISPKAGAGAMFDVVPEEEFMRKLGKEIIMTQRRKKSYYGY